MFYFNGFCLGDEVKGTRRSMWLVSTVSVLFLCVCLSFSLCAHLWPSLCSWMVVWEYVFEWRREEIPSGLCVFSLHWCFSCCPPSSLVLKCVIVLVFGDVSECGPTSMRLHIDCDVGREVWGDLHACSFIVPAGLLLPHGHLPATQDCFLIGIPWVVRGGLATHSTFSRVVVILWYVCVICLFFSHLLHLLFPSFCRLSVISCH